MPSRDRSAIWIWAPVALPVVPRRIFRGYSCGLRPQASEITPRGAISPAERRCARCLSSSAVRGPLFRRQQHSEVRGAPRQVGRRAKHSGLRAARLIASLGGLTSASRRNTRPVSTREPLHGLNLRIFNLSVSRYIDPNLRILTGTESYIFDARGRRI